MYRDVCAHLVEDSRAGEVRDIVGNLEVTVSSSTLGMDHTLRDTLAVEVSDEVDVVEVCCYKTKGLNNGQ